jgi:4-hydroxybenzoyl-CoA thioesterase
VSVFRTTKRVHFGHCDPAGFIFYPRYFDIVHEAEEDWFRQALDWPFSRSVRELKLAFPVVRLDTEYHAPSRLGDLLDIDVRVTRLGGSSLHLAFDLSCEGARRATVRLVAVQMDMTTDRPARIDGELRARIERFRGEVQR